MANLKKKKIKKQFGNLLCPKKSTAYMSPQMNIKNGGCAWKFYELNFINVSVISEVFFINIILIKQIKKTVSSS
jgi:hypothetical protein